MGVFVLVHPAWFGGWCWRKLVPLLRDAGHAALTPTLTGLGERAHLARPEVGLDTHVEDIVRVMTCEDVRDAILVGNSSGGAVITGVADRVPERVAQVVYLDAFTPADGQSILDLLPPERREILRSLVDSEGGGWLLPRFSPQPWEQFVPAAWQITDEADLRWVLERLAPTPFGHFSQPVRRGDPRGEVLPRTYVRCLGWKAPHFDRYAEAARAAGWQCRELDTPHLPYITHPRELAALLDDLAR